MIDDVDCLRGHAELRHERVKGNNLFLLQARLRNEVVELNPEHDLAVGTQLRGEFLRHRGQVLLFIKSLAEKLPQL